MKDVYPELSTIPAGCLVPPSGQPDYVEPQGAVDKWANVGRFLSDLQVELGRGGQPAAINAATGETLTFADLAARSTRLAAALLRIGLKTGVRVAYRSPNVPDVLVVMLAIWKAGGIVVPIPMQATMKDIRFYLEDATPAYLFVHARSATCEEIADAIAGTSVEEAFVFGDGGEDGAYRRAETIAAAESPDAKLPRVDGDVPAILWHTGGTTGRPKGCYHTHRRFILGGYAIASAIGTQSGERWTVAAPIGHALGIIYNTIFTLLHGATVVLVERFADPAALLRAVSDWRVTTLTALSGSWSKMLDVIDGGGSVDHSSITRAFAMWQSASSSEVYDRWKARGVELLNNFGSTAFATWPIAPRPGEFTPRAALGRASPGYEVAAVNRTEGGLTILAQGEIGQLAVKGPTGLTYWNRRELQTRDVVEGWTLSDDLIRFDEQGHIHYLGRSDFMISTGGFKVAPVEVEEVLSRHPAVLEVSVVPAFCETHQEMVVAYVALRAGIDPSEDLAAELRAHTKSELVSYKCPRRIEFVEALPRDQVGKVQTGIVRSWAAARSRAETD